EQLLGGEHFPMRPGMKRAPRICIACCPLDQFPGRPADGPARAMPPTDAHLPGAVPPDVIDVADLTLELTLTAGVVRVLRRMVETGLFGANIEQAAERMLCRAIERELPHLVKF